MIIQRLPRKAILSSIVLVGLLFSIAFAAQTGKVVGVTDGDTIKVLLRGKAVKIRLNGIDCPERKQPFGRKARIFTSELVAGKVVKVEKVDTDRYGRMVANVYLPEGRMLNQELVRAGLAWWYRR